MKSTRCPYIPSCSQYGLEAVKKYGALKGSILAAWRILRCNPFSKGGYEIVNKIMAKPTLAIPTESRKSKITLIIQPNILARSPKINLESMQSTARRLPEHVCLCWFSFRFFLRYMRWFQPKILAISPRINLESCVKNKPVNGNPGQIVI